METLFAQRLKSARIINGLSLQELADKMEKSISRQALHKYEKGDVLPDGETIGMLSEALQVQPDFFYRESTVKLGDIAFRKLDKVTQKEQDRIAEKTKDQLERYLEIEEITETKSVFAHPLQGFRTINSQDDIEEAAEAVRKAWRLDSNPIANVIELLEEKSIKVVELDEDDGFDGLQTYINETYPVIVLNKKKCFRTERKRFTALHELGHLLLAFGDDISEKEQERYCHAFAGALLIPRSAIQNEIGESRTNITIQELGIIKQQFGISIQALIFRLADLKIITKAYLDYLWKHIVQMGWRYEEPFAYIGKETSSRFDRLLYRALSEDVISISKAASLKNQKLSVFRKSLMFAE